MHPKKDISAMANETLDAFDGLQRAEASPFFYSKLLQRMEDRADKSMLLKLFLLISRPQVAMAILLVFLILNAFFVFHLFTQKDESVNEYVAVQQTSYLEFNNYQP